MLGLLWMWLTKSACGQEYDPKAAPGEAPSPAGAKQAFGPRGSSTPLAACRRLGESVDAAVSAQLR
eukprot:6950067-Alexandrium_andersonii.AAC.1